MLLYIYFNICYFAYLIIFCKILSDTLLSVRLSAEILGGKQLINFQISFLLSFIRAELVFILGLS